MNYTPLTYTPFDPSRLHGRQAFPMRALLIAVLVVGVGGSSFFVYQQMNASRVLRNTNASEPIKTEAPAAPINEPTDTVLVATESAQPQMSPSPQATQVPTSLEEFLNKRKSGIKIDQATSP